MSLRCIVWWGHKWETKWEGGWLVDVCEVCGKKKVVKKGTEKSK